MKRRASSLIVFLTAFIGLGVFSAPLTESVIRDDPAAKLLGEWTVAGKFGTGDGEAVFRADMTYLLKEIHPDGLAVTHQGQYKLDPSQEPCAIDLCVGRFSNPGSEWVTTFGILRFISDDESEIHFDPSGRRPESFDGATAENTHRMTRKRSAS